jgi:hypothetical protein
MLHGVLLATTISTFVQVIEIFNSRMGFNRIILVIFTKLPLLIFLFSDIPQLTKSARRKMHRSNSDSRRDRQQRFSFKNRMKPSSLQDVVIYILLWQYRIKLISKRYSQKQ